MGAAPPILVADGDRASRKLVVALLQRIGYETEEAKTGPEALDLATRRRPALVLLEVDLAEVGGYEVCRGLRDAFGGEIAIIFVSDERTAIADRVAGLLVGADDYVVKPFHPDEFLARIRVALRRTTEFRAGTSGVSVVSVGASLTPREREVLHLLAEGLNQADIAATLVISPKTVGGHLQRILAKLGVHSRAQAVAVAHQHGLMAIGTDGHAA